MTRNHQSGGSVQQLLTRVNKQGHFVASVLTDSDGLPIAAAAPLKSQLADMLAAIAPLVQRMVQRSNERAGLSEAYEVVINNADRLRLVCRFFEARQQTLILACLVTEDLAYRRAMNEAAQAIQRIWAE
jgi:predicted regulator of Ras-like GTPase activity (Roadblock/LC7/MglB family)